MENSVERMYKNVQMFLYRDMLILYKTHNHYYTTILKHLSKNCLNFSLLNIGFDNLNPLFVITSVRPSSHYYWLFVIYLFNSYYNNYNTIYIGYNQKSRSRPSQCLCGDDSSIVTIQIN